MCALFVSWLPATQAYALTATILRSSPSNGCISSMFQEWMVVVELISNPFIDTVDFMATDAVLCSSEQCILGSLRCTFQQTMGNDQTVRRSVFVASFGSLCYCVCLGTALYLRLSLRL